MEKKQKLKNCSYSKPYLLRKLRDRLEPKKYFWVNSTLFIKNDIGTFSISIELDNIHSYVKIVLIKSILFNSNQLITYKIPANNISQLLKKVSKFPDLNTLLCNAQ